MIEMNARDLPWQHVDDNVLVQNMKKSIPLEHLCRHMPLEFLNTCQYVTTLAWDQIPDYARIHTWWRSCLSSANEYTRKFDWELTEE